MGMVPMESKPGDEVCILLGGSAPFVLRHADRSHHIDVNDYYTLVGDCYLHGIMNGELMHQPIPPDIKTFKIQ